MNKNFSEYLHKKNTQKNIDKLSRKYKGKKVILYGAGSFAENIIKDYDLSELNILGIADSRFSSNQEEYFQGFKTINPYLLPETDFDVLIITVYDDSNILDFIEDTLFYQSKPNFKIETLIKLSFWEYFKI